MNPITMAVTQHAAVSGESMQMLARWLTRNDGAKPLNSVRQHLAERYPHGLLSEEELEALLGSFSVR